MKKVLLSLAAVAAIAACSKSEVEYETPAEIGFAPVAKLSTKAAVASTDYPDALNMYVFANAGLDGTDANTTVEAVECTEAYLKNAEFAHGTHATNVFGGVTPYYWPNVKSLVFSGYSKSGNVSSLTPSYEAVGNTWVIKMNGYAPGTGTAATKTNPAGNNDLMWFPTTGSYTKREAAIAVQMKHACSWVTLNLKGDAITGATTDAWKIHKLEITNVAHSGNVVLGATASWTPATDKSSLTAFNLSEGKALTTEYVDYTNLDIKDMILVPQPTQKLYVTYSFVSQKGAGTNVADIVIEETKEIPLTYTSDNGWQPGVHYTYNITIGTKEILVEPTVMIWDTKDVPAIEF